MSISSLFLKNISVGCFLPSKAMTSEIRSVFESQGATFTAFESIEELIHTRNKNLGDAYIISKDLSIEESLAELRKLLKHNLNSKLVVLTDQYDAIYNSDLVKLPIVYCPFDKAKSLLPLLVYQSRVKTCDALVKANIQYLVYEIGKCKHDIGNATMILELKLQRLKQKLPAVTEMKEFESVAALNPRYTAIMEEINIVRAHIELWLKEIDPAYSSLFADFTQVNDNN